jgi:hypothetical protein
MVAGRERSYLNYGNVSIRTAFGVAEQWDELRQPGEEILEVAKSSRFLCNAKKRSDRYSAGELYFIISGFGLSK